MAGALGLMWSASWHPATPVRCLGCPCPPSIRPCASGSAASFEAPTAAQTQGWPAIARGESTLMLAPTGSGKTLAAFLWCLNRLMFDAAAGGQAALARVLYVSPLKALAVDVERNLRAPLAGIAHAAARRGDAYRVPSIVVRTGDTPASERARFQREPADILITTPESLYLLLTSNAREALPRSTRSSSTRSTRWCRPSAARTSRCRSSGSKRSRERPLQRIGLSATQRPLDEVARFLGGVDRRASPRPRRRRRAGGPARPRAPRRPGTAATRDARDPRRVRRRTPGRCLPAGHHRRRRREEAAQPAHRGAGRGHGATRPSRSTSRAARPRRARCRPVDLVGDPSAAARADPRRIARR